MAAEHVSTQPLCLQLTEHLLPTAVYILGFRGRQNGVAFCSLSFNSVFSLRLPSSARSFSSSDLSRILLADCSPPSRAAVGGTGPCFWCTTK